MVYVDEKFDGATGTYIIGSVVVMRGILGALHQVALNERRQPPPMPLKKPFHWHKATPARRDKFLRAMVVAHNLPAYGIVKLNVIGGSQESAREACLRRLVVAVAPLGVTEFILDQRDTQGKIYLDNRAFGRFHSAGILPANVIHRMAYAPGEPVLTIADAVVGVTLGLAGSLPDLAVIDAQLTRRTVP